ncbi:MAG TPA: hypothetical protein VMG12_02745 [Polyangiaceae bacterium]|nr:hypothetical protein [Polyangiaceae bacterium]
MLTQFAALGIGLTTLVTTSIAAAAPPCEPAYPTAGYPTYGAPVPVYAPAPPVYAPAPVPVYAPAPPVYAPRAQAPRRVESTQVVMRRADYNRDGGVTWAEAQAYGRYQFARADYNRDGVLTRREQRDSNDDFIRVSDRRGSRDGVVTLAEYDNAVYNDFYQLDRNRDGFLSRYELGQSAPSTGVTWSWNWSL